MIRREARRYVYGHYNGDLEPLKQYVRDRWGRTEERGGELWSKVAATHDLDILTLDARVRELEAEVALLETLFAQVEAESRRAY